VTTYDDGILQQYADSLYREAAWIVWWTAVAFGLVAFLVSGVVLVAISALGPQMGINGNMGSAGLPVVLFITVLGVVAGVGAGKQKSFKLKLQAQQILCQRQIELNTR
jgi:hypothetical protein